MKYAADFREIARNALRGKWAVAVLTGFLASLMGAGIATSGGSSSLGNSSNGSGGNLINELQMSSFLRTLLIAAVIIIVLWVIATIIIGGAAKLGYAVFNLKLVDNKDAAVSDLFSQFHRLGNGFCMNFFMGLFISLWSILLVIPGIIKTFSYAMTPYILAENPGMGALDAITASRRMMDGNKWRLFCLSFSFIGWSLLCAVPALIGVGVVSAIAAISGNLLTLMWAIPCFIPTFIGSLFLTPYMEAAYAAFYREVSGSSRPALGEGI